MSASILSNTLVAHCFLETKKESKNKKVSSSNMGVVEKLSGMQERFNCNLILDSNGEFESPGTLVARWAMSGCSREGLMSPKFASNGQAIGWQIML